MRKLGVMTVLVLVAFGLGATGVPGNAMAAAADWLVDSGHVQVPAPVSEAVRQAI